MKRHLLVVSCLIGSLDAQAAWQTSDRHVMMLYPGVDEVLGTTLVVVENNGVEEELINLPILLPKEMIDFQAQEGVSQNQLKATDDGRIVAELNIPPGRRMIGVGFKVSADHGHVNLTFSPQTKIPNLSVIVPRDQMSLKSNDLSGPEVIEFGAQQQSMWSKLDVAAQQQIHIALTDVPKGRGRLWLLGSLMGLVILLSSIFLAWRHKPKLDDQIS